MVENENLRIFAMWKKRGKGISGANFPHICGENTGEKKNLRIAEVFEKVLQNKQKYDRIANGIR